MNNLLKLLSLAAYLSVAAFSTNTSAAAVAINFSTGTAGSGGTISDVNGDGSYITGTNINIGVLEAVGTSADGVYSTNAFLDFDTGGNTITVTGTVAGLGINSDIVLLSGSFSGWTYGSTGLSASFSGSGVDTKHNDLLTALGVPLNTQFEYFGFTLGYDFDLDGNATAISTSVLNTSVVPVPAAAWLFGSGLLGLVGIARRKNV